MIQEHELTFAALERMPTDRDLPSDDGVPLDNIWHRPAINLLIESIECHWHGRKDFFVGGDNFIYFSHRRVFNEDFRGPDFFLVKGADHDEERLSWVSWQEDGRLPNVIVELISKTTAHIDRGPKWKLYGETMRVAEYFIYDPSRDGLVEGWRLGDKMGYGAPLIAEAEGRIWSEQLEMYIGPWNGIFQANYNRWPRFFDVHGNLIPTFAEAGAAAAAEADRAWKKEAATTVEVLRRAELEAEKAVEAERLMVAEALRASEADAARQAAEAEVRRLQEELEALRRQRPAPPS